MIKILCLREENNKGPSLKGGEGGVLPKAYAYCFGDVIILLKCAQGGRGVKLLAYLSLRSL